MRNAIVGLVGSIAAALTFGHPAQAASAQIQFSTSGIVRVQSYSTAPVYRPEQYIAQQHYRAAAQAQREARPVTSYRSSSYGQTQTFAPAHTSTPSLYSYRQ